MMANQSFCLKWEGYQTNVTSVFDELRHHDELVDITLCCEGQRIGAHRMLLSACSPYFRDVLKANSCQHMVFYMKDTSASDLRALVEFMYKGSVNVSQNQLASFIRTAEALQIRGLSGEDEQKPSGAAPPRLAPPPPPPQPIVAQKRLAPASVNSVDGASASSPSHLLQQQHSAHDQAALLSLKQSLLSAAAAAVSGGGGGGGNCSPALKRRRHNSGGVITAPSSSCTTSTSSSGVVDLPAATTSTTSSSSSSSSSTSSAVTAAAVVAAAGAGVSEDASVTAVAATTTGGLSEDAAEPSPASSHQSAPSPRTTDAADDAPAAANDVASRHDGDEQLQDATAAVAAHVSLDDVKVEKVDLTEDSGDDEVDDEMAVATAGDMSSSLETALGQVADYENYDDAGGSALLSSSDFHQQLAMADYSGELGVPGPSHMMTAEDGNSQEGGASVGGGSTCRVCGRFYLNAVSLKHHMAQHRGLTVCSMCGHVSSRIGNLRVHLRRVHQLSSDDVELLVPRRIALKPRDSPFTFPPTSLQ